MWRRRRGLQRLADEVAEARAEQAELRRRVAAFEMIAAAAAPADLAAPLPPVLAAAARELRSTEVPSGLTWLVPRWWRSSAAAGSRASGGPRSAG